MSQQECNTTLDSLCHSFRTQINEWRSHVFLHISRMKHPNFTAEKWHINCFNLTEDIARVMLRSELKTLFFLGNHV